MPGLLLEEKLKEVVSWNSSLGVCYPIETNVLSVNLPGAGGLGLHGGTLCLSGRVVVPVTAELLVSCC